MLGGQYWTPIVERPEAPLLISYQWDRQESSGVKIGRRFTIVVFLASPDSKRINGQVHYATGQIGPLSFIYSTGVSSVSIFYAASVTTRAEARKVRSADGARERSRAPQKTEMETLAARSLQLDLSTGCSRFREARWSRRSRRFFNRPSRRSKNLPPRIPPIFSIPPDLIKARDRP
jgi:hypothetical protein